MTLNYYLHINNGKIDGIGNTKVVKEGWENVEITKEQWDIYEEKGSNYFLYINGEIVLNPDYEEEQRQKEQERINQLTMTALDFINFLKQSGLTDEMIEVYLNNNLNIKHQLQFCQNVYCGVAKQIFTEPITIGNVTITADMVESAFRVKHGELPDKEIVE